ncbi:alpha-1,2-fucosyltransferase [Flavobacterium geliluteum]|uniref:Alpha-1,2-fucosyltransferase n=1 Tax=Flavobacterium geliluteum TaxID=2816120 RepID=A0A940XDT1_9FLAO|nr:alpha-1,2-fucosyltransferase [Flavobacterium geliluteum]MBP4137834.1 alpha-1,2-fucosyltransferase [Flavobacterium geliluteum]
MITFSKLGKKGNLGNQLFQIASTIGFAEKFGHEYFFPDWNYSKYFKNWPPAFYKDESFEIVNEKEFNYYEWNLKKGNYDIDGWLQSEKYFNVEKTKKLFQFESFSQDLYAKYSFLFSKKTILVSVRRGDFVRHPHYYQLSYLFYFKSIIENFPDWRDRNIVFTSDDISYCKYHFSFLKNVFFLEDLTPINQLVLGAKCDDFIISNSTFSWWIAWLGEKEKSKIIRPIKIFQGEFAERNNDSDYFPDRWFSFDDSSFGIEKKYFTLYVRGFLYEFLIDIRCFYHKSKKRIKVLIKQLFRGLK